MEARYTLEFTDVFYSKGRKGEPLEEEEMCEFPWEFLFKI
jgi:hypothetical protein